jgi:hypothetical protein
VGALELTPFLISFLIWWVYEAEGSKHLPAEVGVEALVERVGVRGENVYTTQGSKVGDQPKASLFY